MAVIPLHGRKNRVFIYEQSTTIQELVSHEMMTSWPEYRIKIGSHCLVKRGVAIPGQLIGLYYKGEFYVNLLIYRNVNAKIWICGSSGGMSRLNKGEYEIEGPVVRVNDPPRPPLPKSRLPIFGTEGVTEWQDIPQML